MKSVGICSDALWDKLCIKANRAVVFMDNACAEILHWNCGLGRLIAAGALDVRELSPFESATQLHKKGMFITSGVLADMTADTIRNVIQASHFQYVIVITTVSPAVHLYSRTGNMEGDESAMFEQFEDNILEWMGNMNYTAEVIHIPLFTASVGGNMFVTPAYTNIFPLVQTDLGTVQRHYNSTQVDKKVFESLNEVELVHLPATTQLQYKIFVSSLHGLLESLGVREDIYCVGNTSRMLAVELENYPPAKLRRKAATNRASLVLVDRTLDLSSAVSHQGSNLLERIVSLLPRLGGHHNDVQVDMSPVCLVNNDSILVPGCLAGITPLASTYLDTLVTAKPKEAMMEIHRNLVEAAAAEGLPLSLSGKPGRVTAEQIHKTVALFRGKYKAITAHLDTLQIAMATATSLQHPGNSHYDCLSGVEKGLVQVAAEQGGISLLSHIKKSIEIDCQKPKDERLYNLDDVWSFIVYAYSLCLEKSVDGVNEEKEFRTFLTQQIIKEKDDLPPFTRALVGDTVTLHVVSAIVEDSWDKLVASSSVRDDLKQFRSILDPGSDVNPASHKPFLHQMVDAILDPSKPELVDLEYKSSGFRDKLKSSFSLFMNVSKPRPSDHPTLMLFVVGGITASEMKQIKDAVQTRTTDIQVVIGSTRLLQPMDVLQAVFCQDNVCPGGG